jgi:hypothetical protein
MENALWVARHLTDPDSDAIEQRLNELRAELARTGTVPLMPAAWLYELGLKNEAFELLEAASFAYLFDREGPPPSGLTYTGAIFSRSRGIHGDPRFPRLCAKLGLCDYWTQTGKWPDCADEVAYDFRTEARKAAEGLAQR